MLQLPRFWFTASGIITHSIESQGAERSALNKLSSKGSANGFMMNFKHPWVCFRFQCLLTLVVPRFMIKRSWKRGFFNCCYSSSFSFLLFLSRRTNECFPSYSSFSYIVGMLVRPYWLQHLGRVKFFLPTFPDLSDDPARIFLLSLYTNSRIKMRLPQVLIYNSEGNTTIYRFW